MKNVEKKSDKLLDELIKFSKRNEKILKEWKNLIKKTDKQIFRDYCHKEYIKECEPWYCSYRITGNCEYPRKIKKLEKEI